MLNVLDVVACSNCAAIVDEADAKDAGWRFWSDGVGELVPFCGLCADREFRADAPRRADAVR